MSENEPRQLSLFELDPAPEPALGAEPDGPGSSDLSDKSDQSVESVESDPPPAPAPLNPPLAEIRIPREARMQQISAHCCVCEACGLAETRTQVVFGEGNARSPLVIVGEGPGEQEDATGRPFVGRAGALLDKALRENGIARQHVWITNVLKCRACVVEGRRVANRPPRIDEVEACHTWLEQEIGTISPRVILCLGGPAASWVIHPDFKITRERGKWFPTKWAQAAMATLHPAYVLRQEGAAYDEARATLVRDIGEAKSKAIELLKKAPAGKD